MTTAMTHSATVVGTLPPRRPVRDSPHDRFNRALGTQGGDPGGGYKGDHHPVKDGGTTVRKESITGDGAGTGRVAVEDKETSKKRV